MKHAILNRELIGIDARLPVRDELLDAESVKRRIGESLGLKVENCIVIRAKYRFNSSLRVLYRIETESGSEFVSARIYAGDPPRTDFYLFPNDRKITGLGLLRQRYRSRLVAYAPEKCATVECLDANGEIFGYAKIYAEKEWAAGRTAGKFLAERAGSGFPQLLGFDEANRILLIEAVQGRRLCDLGGAELATGFRNFGAAIGQLHNVSTAAALPRFTRLTPERIEGAAALISEARPDCREQVEMLAARLLAKHSSAGEEIAVLHGDVHPKNCIVRIDGSLMLIDFDQLSYGNPAAEIGSFFAGLIYREVIGLETARNCRDYAKAFLAGYAGVRPLPGRDSLSWHTAAALLSERALRSISRLRIGGLERFAQILTAAEESFEGGCR